MNDLDQVYDLMDEMESLSEEEFKTRLNDLKKKFGVVWISKRRRSIGRQLYVQTR